ncbi:MAG: FAD-dependent thymidylate synthase [Thermoplasmata archaeon]
MEVKLAGYNIDSSIIDKVRATESLSDLPLSPETIAVAYARISRDSSPVTELRKKAIDDVEAARKSAKSIVFEMNHQSVAEHAVFNFDILDISRLCVESLEWHRLCSYTEKSQRYQELVGDYVLPKEFEGEARPLFESTMKDQNELYNKAFKVLLEHFKGKYPHLLEKKWDRRMVEGYAKEDARYAVGLATKAQLGFTANARNLEYLIRRMRANPLSEVNTLGEEFFRLAGNVAPSLILLTDPVVYQKEFGRPLNDDHFINTHPNASRLASETMKNFDGISPGREYPASGDVKLIDWSEGADRATLQAILHAHSLAPAEACDDAAGKLIRDGGAEAFIQDYLGYSNPWESATREFEFADFTFEVILSSACYGQMKRHRMSSQLVQPYNPELGFTYPPSVIETGLQKEFEQNYRQSSEAYYELTKYSQPAAAYVLTNGHRRRMLIRANARELHHISRLREDTHAQWDVRKVSGDMLSLAREKSPVCLMLAWGKDRFPEKKNDLLGN